MYHNINNFVNDTQKLIYLLYVAMFGFIVLSFSYPLYFFISNNLSLTANQSFPFMIVLLLNFSFLAVFSTDRDRVFFYLFAFYFLSPKMPDSAKFHNLPKSERLKIIDDHINKNVTIYTIFFNLLIVILFIINIILFILLFIFHIHYYLPF